jgi:hypothetical protein
MANSLDNVIRIAQETFVDQLAQSTEDYARCCEVLDYEGGQARLMATNAGGLAQSVTSATTSVTASDLTSGISTITQEAFVLKHRVPWAQLNWSTNLAADAGRQLANAAAQNVNKLFFDGLGGLFTANHPMAGAGQGQVGVGKHFIDTGLGFAQTTPAAGTQDNLLVAALSETTLDAAKQLLRNYRNQQALPMNMAGSNMVLVVSPKNERIAKELIGSVYSGSDMQTNTFAQYAQVIVHPFATDDDDWFLIDRDKSPVGIWMGEAPTLDVLPSEDGIFVNMVAKFQASFYAKAYEFGIIGSNVP